MKTKKVYIQGMHCVSCEKLLDDEFRNLKNVKDVTVDRNANQAEIFYENQEPSFVEIENVAKKYGYKAFEYEPAQEKQGTLNQWVTTAIIFLAIFLGYRFIQGSGLLDWVSVKNTEINFGVAFVVGLVASVSSCLAVVGAVIIAFGEKYQAEGKNFYQNAVRPNVLFHVGRLATFFVLGGLLGLLGGEISISGSEVAVFTIGIALVMGWLGLNILGLVPSIANLGVRMPGRLTRHWDALKHSKHAFAPALLGASSFFLPCGFTQSMQLFALSSGSFWTGSMTLFLFALGTVPSLLILGVTASWTRSKKVVVLQRVAGLVVVLFAIYTFQSGLALWNVKTNVLSTDTTASRNTPIEKNNDSIQGDEQIVEMHITSSGFSPNILKLKKGIPVKWVIKGDRVTNCTNRIIVPSLDINKDIVSGDNIVRFTPKTGGEIPFSCWMGMVRGKFIVE